VEAVIVAVVPDAIADVDSPADEDHDPDTC
jgi:hypothetical protein